jgi:hypothetical protein
MSDYDNLYQSIKGIAESIQGLNQQAVREDARSKNAVFGDSSLGIRPIRHPTPVSAYSTSDSGFGAFDIRLRCIRHLTPVYSTSDSGLFDIRLRSIRHPTPKIRHNFLLHNTFFSGNSITL